MKIFQWKLVWKLFNFSKNLCNVSENLSEFIVRFALSKNIRLFSEFKNRLYRKISCFLSITLKMYETLWFYEIISLIFIQFFKQLEFILNCSNKRLKVCRENQIFYLKECAISMINTMCRYKRETPWTFIIWESQCFQKGSHIFVNMWIK